MTLIALFLTATKLAGALFTLTVAANAVSYSRFRKNNLRRFRSPIDESSETLADFNFAEEEFFFGLATAPAHVEDRLDDAWIRFAEEKSDDSNGRQTVDAVMASASGDGGSQRAATSPRGRKPLKVAMEAMIRGFEKYLEVEGKEGEVEPRPNVTAWHNVPRPEERLRFWSDPETEIKLAKDTGVTVFRMGIDWTRIMPVEPVNSLNESVNYAALERYKWIINKVRSYGMKVMLTLFHHSLPPWAGEYGGWKLEKTVDYFMDFTRLVVDSVSDSVDYWVTFNEPHVFCMLTYCAGAWPGGHPDMLEVATSALPTGVFQQAMHWMSVAHLKAYDYIHGLSNPLNPIVGVAHHVSFMRPFGLYDVAAVSLANSLTLFPYIDGISEKLDYIGINYYGQEVVSGLAYNLKLAPWKIPFEFRKLKNLRRLWMTRCNLIGEIPEYFGDIFTNLVRLDLSMNKLSGSIPRTLFSLRKLRFLYLFSNRLSGVIPSATMQCLELIDVDLAKNNLTGSIPREFGELKNLSTLHLYENHLFGEIPVSLSQIPTLKYFRVFSNNLSGTLPPELGLHSKLAAIEVSDNQLSGGLPEHLCAGGALIGVVVSSNNFSGVLPESIVNCPSLATVQVYNNKFSGEVPLGLWTMSNLSSLILSNNSFSGPLPGQVFWNIARIEIANNNFSGGISVGITSAKNLGFLDARNNMLSGEIPRELTQLSKLTALMLDGNQLSGALPSEIISWQSLNTLTLSRNKLSGQIPTAITALPRLAYLDLSQNDISGEIPPQFDRLRFVFLNLSSNQLSGKIPDEFNNLAFENSFLNNPRLCAYNPNIHLDNCLTKTASAAPQSSNSSSNSLALILAATAVVLLAIVSLVFYTLKTQWGKKHCGHKNKVATWRLTSFQRLDLKEINFLSSLTDNNLIGSGGFGKVYRIASNRPGEYVAVKKIWNREDVDDTLEKEFQAEVEILGNIRHSNIVKLLCCYASENSKLLVYEYMENQSLDKWLHAEKKSPTGLSWPTRLNIAIGAAQGLCYMHHECSPPVIHRDVKSSNILLDSEFRAKIADFGLAKMLSKPGELNTMSALAGSFGYIPPEYAYSTKINEKVDVYSFGVVLLELVTGRKPNMRGEHACSLVEWAWEHFTEAKSLTDAFDEDIKEPRYAEEMANVFKLGLLCTSSLPSTRPSAKEIMQVLRRCCHSGSTRRRVGNEFDIAPLLSDTRYVCSYKESNAATNNSSW